MNPLLQWGLGILGTLIVAAVLYLAKLIAGKIDKTEVIAEFNALKTQTRDLERDFAAHKADRELHIDPTRDERRFGEFQGTVVRRFDRLEEKIEKLMIAMPHS